MDGDESKLEGVGTKVKEGREARKKADEGERQVSSSFTGAVTGKRKRAPGTEERKDISNSITKSTTKKPKTSKTSKTSKASKTSTSSTTANRTNFSKKIMTSASLALFAEDNDIPPEDLARAYDVSPTSTTLSSSSSSSSLRAPSLTGRSLNDPSKTAAGKYISMDCEMVGVGPLGRENGERSALARVSIVNYHGHILLDTFVLPKEKVVDWRTYVSGVRPSDMENAKTFEETQTLVSALLTNRILIGHSVQNDLDCLLLSHPRRSIRDTSCHPSFRALSGGRTPGLKKLAREILGVEIQGGEHSSVEDARATMLLYRKYKAEFEGGAKARFPSGDGGDKGGSRGGE